jgi:SPP1 family predicted phage head-tail adaptor
VGSCCDTLAASLRHRLTIQTVTRTEDGQGGFTEAWADGDSVWASITPLKAYQRFQAMQMQAPATHKVVMRYRSDVSNAVRLTFGDRVFSVAEVLNVEERNRFLEITVTEQA